MTARGVQCLNQIFFVFRVSQTVMKARPICFTATDVGEGVALSDARLCCLVCDGRRRGSIGRTTSRESLDIMLGAPICLFAPSNPAYIGREAVYAEGNPSIFS